MCYLLDVLNFVVFYGGSHNLQHNTIKKIVFLLDSG